MLYWILKKVLGPFAKVIFRPEVVGAEHVPLHGAAILASNHLSFSDSIFLPAVLERRITFPAKMEYFTGTGLSGWAKKTFFTAAGQIPIDRSGGKAAAAAIEAGLQVLARDELFGIYPEGTRSPDGRLYKGKTGMVRMAIQAGVPIIPVAMIDTDKAQPTGQRIPKVVRIGVRFGEPIRVDHLTEFANDRRMLRAVTDEVMFALAELSGQEYVDEYAATRKAALAARATETAERAQAVVADAAERAQLAAHEAAERAQVVAGRAKEVANAAAGNAQIAAEQASARARQVRDEADRRLRSTRRTGAGDRTSDDG